MLNVDGSEDEMEYDDVAGGDEVNQLDLDFIDGETNLQDQEPIDYRLMNVTRDLQDAIAYRSLALDLDLIAVDPENFVSDLIRSVMSLMNFLVLKNAFESLMRNLKFLRENQKIPFTFSYSMLSIISNLYHLWQKTLASLKKKIIRSSRLKFIQNNETYSGPFNSLADDKKIRVLNYFCGGTGVIPYEKIKFLEDLDAVPKGDFFSKVEFYSSLKNEIIDDESYESVKKFWKLMPLNKLSKLSDIYNFQDTIILCKIFENRAIEMMEKFSYNLLKRYLS